MALYNTGIPYGAMNPEHQRQAEAQKKAVETERANREKGKNAVAQYKEQYPTAWSALANNLAVAGKTADGASQVVEKVAPTPTQAVKGKLEDAMQYEQNTPGQVNPDSTADPAKAIAVNTQNRQEGYSNGVKKPPEAPTMPEIELAMEEQKTKQVTFDTNQIPNWYESNSFWNGLMAAGITLMDNGTLGQAFNAGGKVFQEGFAKEKRQMWAQDLLDQGFDQHEVQAWIETGDQKVLTDPMQKKMQEQAYQLGQYQLQEAAYKGSKEYKEYEREMRNWENELKVDEINANREHRAFQQNQDIARLGLERERLGIAKQEAARKAQMEGVKYNEGEAKAYNQYTRAQQGLKNYVDTADRLHLNYTDQGAMKKLYDASTIEMMFSGNQMAETMGRLTNPETAEMVNSEREFLAPLLRKDSGAAISKTEWKTTGEIYFPRPGDTPERIAQKAQSREVALISMDPRASKDMKAAVDRYSHGQNNGLRWVNGQVFEKRGNDWYVISPR